MKNLIIETNHGFLHLRDVTITKNETYGSQAEGVVVASAQTSRLFTASSTREIAPKGSRYSYTIWRAPQAPWKDDDKDSDTWRVSTVSCG